MDFSLTPDMMALYAISASFIQPIFNSVVRNSFDEIIKIFTSDSLKDLFKRNDWNQAVKESITAFIGEFKKALDETRLTSYECNAFSESLTIFIEDHAVRIELGRIITNDRAIIFLILARRWKALNLKPLPKNFDWIKLSQLYKEVVIKIIESKKELHQMISDKVLITTAKATRGSIVRNIESELREYAKALLIHYEYLNNNCLYPQSREDCNPIKLIKVFVEQSVRSFQQFNLPVYELTSERRNELKHQKFLEKEFENEKFSREREIFFHQQTLPILDVINSPKRNQRLIAILGTPGSGKSALLNHIAVQWAVLSTLDRDTQPIPLLIELKNYARNFQEGHCENFLAYLDRAPSAVAHLNENDLDELLRQGDAILLLDGFDEVFEHHLRRQIATELVLFSIRYPLVQFIITSRIIGYELIAHILKNASFQHYILQELSIEQQESFLIKWHDLAYSNPQERKNKYDRLRTAICDVAIRELAENPLLLTLMAILNKYKDLPRDRHTLYLEASKVMLDQWDTEKVINNITDSPSNKEKIEYRHKFEMLQSLALKMQTSSEGFIGNIITGNEIEKIFIKYLEPHYDHYKALSRSLVRQLRERNNIICMVGIIDNNADYYYAFVHRTFLEFFCASAWLFLYQKADQENRYTLDKLEEETFRKFWKNEKWHEVLRLIISQIDIKDAAKIITHLLIRPDVTKKFQNVFFAASCFAIIHPKKSLGNLNNQLDIEIEKLAHFDLPYYYAPWDDERIIVKDIREAAIRAKASCWPNLETTKQWLKNQVQNNDNASAQQVAIQEIVKGWKDCPNMLDWLILILKDDNCAIRQAAVREIARGWKDRPETLAILKDTAQNDDNWSVQQAALQELAKGWRDDVDILDILKREASENPKKDVRWAAIREIARGWKNHEDTLIWLQQQTRNNDNWAARQAAVRELSRGWRDDSKTLIWLQQQAQKNTDWAVRQTAVKELARCWRDSPETLFILKNSINDSDERIQQTALQELARGWKNDPDTFIILKHNILNNNSIDSKKIALQEIVRGWKDEVETIEILKEQAKNDKQNNIRQTAIQELVRGWTNDSEIRSILLYRAENDEYLDVRKAAVEALARGWKNDYETLTWLKHSAENDKHWKIRQTAVQAISRGWRDDADTLIWLKQRGEKDDHWDVRQAAVQALARGWRNDAGVFMWIKTKALNDIHWAVQKVAVYEMARGLKNDHNTHNWLKEQTDSEYWAIRQAALQELVRGWKNDPDTLRILKEKSRSEESAVQQVALQILALGWKNDPETLQILKHIAQTKNEWPTKKLAFEEILRGWKGDAEILRWFHAQNESNDEWIARGYISDLIETSESKDKLSWLQDQALHAESWTIQQAAIRELEQRWDIHL